MKFDINSTQHWQQLLIDLNACQEAKDDNVGRSLSQAWKQSVSGERLLWLAARLGAPANLLRLAACDCARTALQYVPAGELRPLHAIEAAERYARGEATSDELEEARVAATKAEAEAEEEAETEAGTTDAAEVNQAATLAIDAAAAAAARTAAAAAAAAPWAAVEAAVRAAIGAQAAWAAEVAVDKKMARLVRARIPFAALVPPELEGAP